MSWAPKEILHLAKTRQMKLKTTQPELVAYTVHVGSYSQLGEVFKKIAEWANKNGYEVSGAPRTVYYNEAGSVPDNELITEVQIPVKKKAGSK
jgi:effector-binding domain-containing protein